MENTILIIISSIFLFWVNYITFPKLIELVNSENMRLFGLFAGIGFILSQIYFVFVTILSTQWVNSDILVLREVNMNKDKLKSLYEKAKHETVNDSFNSRHLDTAYNAISLDELRFVVENTTSKSVQDYAIIKLNYFANKEN